MNWSKKLKKSKPSDMAYSRIKRLLDEMIYKKVELFLDGTKAIVCNDCVVVFTLDEDGYAGNIVPAHSIINFDLNLTPKEMDEFNGGFGCSRYFKYRKEIQEKYKQ